MRLSCLIHHSFTQPTQLPGSGFRKTAPSYEQGRATSRCPRHSKMKEGWNRESRELRILRQKAWASAFITNLMCDLRVTPTPFEPEWPHL